MSRARRQALSHSGGRGRWIERITSVVFAIAVIAVQLLGTTVAKAAPYVYDVHGLPRGGTQAVDSVEARLTQPGKAREGSASPSSVSWGMSTTPPQDFVATEAVPNGEFSISNWDGYPAGGPKPEGPFRLLEGDEYSAARNAANKANSALHDADPNLSGLQIHEVQPVKFGGSPTDLANKVVLTPAEHMQYTVWWNRVQRSIS